MAAPGKHTSAPAQTVPSRKDIEAVKIAAGYRGQVKFVLVPRTSLAINTPDDAVRRAFAKPRALQIELPIKGTCKDLPSRDIPCTLSLLVDRGGQIASHPVSGKAVMKVQGNAFEVQVDGKKVVVDIVEHQLVQSGKLGFSFTPDFPHAEAATLAPDIAFNNALDLGVQMGPQRLVGDLVVFTPQHDRIFNDAALELRIVESDDAAGDASSPGGASFLHRWEPGAKRGGRAWAIGFLDEGCGHFSDVTDEKEGAFDFSWQLWGASKTGGTQSLLLEKKNFLSVAKPRLQEFRLQYAPRLLDGTHEVHGKIDGIASRARLLVEVSLVDPATPEPAPSDLGHTVRLQLSEDGAFEGHLGPPHWFSAPPEQSFAAPEQHAYAVLSLPAAAREGKPAPIAPYLQYDAEKHPAWTPRTVTVDPAAPWVASEEARGVPAQPAPAQPAPAPAAQPTPAQPVSDKLCKNDIPVVSSGVGGCKAALLHCEQAPFAGKITNGKDVWAWVGSDNAPQRLFTFFHGYYRGVRVSKVGRPDDAAGNHFKLGEAADAFKHPVVLAPKCASGKEEQKSSTGNLTGGSKLGEFIDDAFAHLYCLPKDASCGGAKYLSPLRRKDDVSRHYLMGHSGGGKALGQAALSDYAFAKPTCLVLLDSQYGYYQRKGSDAVRQFVDHWAGLGKLGLGDDTSRVLIVSRIYDDSGTNDETIKIRDGLRSAGYKVAEISEPKPSGVKPRKDREPFPDSERHAVADALRKNAIVVVWTPVSHDDIPTYFVPVALDAG